jgi:hypothetical protein
MASRATLTGASCRAECRSAAVTDRSGSRCSAAPASSAAISSVPGWVSGRMRPW